MDTWRVSDGRPPNRHWRVGPRCHWWPPAPAPAGRCLPCRRRQQQRHRDARTATRPTFSPRGVSRRRRRRYPSAVRSPPTRAPDGERAAGPPALRCVSLPTAAARGSSIGGAISGLSPSSIDPVCSRRMPNGDWGEVSGGGLGLLGQQCFFFSMLLSPSQVPPIPPHCTVVLASLLHRVPTKKFKYLHSQLADRRT